MYDFHTHTFLSDGVLAPVELIRRALAVGYEVMAITDHVGAGNMEFVLKTLIADCRMASNRWDILALPGVEITHTPHEDIDRLAQEARRLGAKVVNVHGETISEPVDPGTNLAAASSMHVDILAHPGLITLEEAHIAAGNGVFLEVTARRGHAYANGHVVQMAKEAGASTVLDSDAHGPDDLLKRDFAMKVARGAGLDVEQAESLLDSAPKQFLRKLGVQLEG
ncbi:MAG: histidinol phosphate phosphatase domain-containing protein [SAR202 cluster bacterium]|nr:histidinol phosphate phosphatase domain-containing protein [SAR202 cluster bacterium]MDP7224372.1 histidinol phosphate phosphatase domain-containing protein [SAR202 cluster bacterium]MDP7413437.1 histidinol phosphate phosphatase domain-containing protein [SAR202 cluster bacterium]MDP7532320.1 histidinol phosphate phosphatase domain-containing protein [SAR202 cluster bacterium]